MRQSPFIHPRAGLVFLDGDLPVSRDEIECGHRGKRRVGRRTEEVVCKTRERMTGHYRSRCITPIGVITLESRRFALVVVAIAWRCTTTLHGEEGGDRLVARAALQPQDGRLHARNHAGLRAALVRARVTRRT